MMTHHSARPSIPRLLKRTVIPLWVFSLNPPRRRCQHPANNQAGMSAGCMIVIIWRFDLLIFPINILDDPGFKVDAQSAFDFL
jgi:hypothetical protein